MLLAELAVDVEVDVDVDVDEEDAVLEDPVVLVELERQSCKLDWTGDILHYLVLELQTPP